MEKYLFSITFLFLIQISYATVGGSSYIADLRYNSKDNAIYFIRTDESGRGCPPELISISLKNSKEKIIVSCEEGENNPTSDKIKNLTQNLNNLYKINLNTNNFSFKLSYLNDEFLDEEKLEKIHSNFKLEIYQNNQKLKEEIITACHKDQPFILSGYLIDEKINKLALLLTAKNNCFEGGYIKERLFIVDNVKILDKNFFVNYLKTDSFPIIDEGNVILYYKENEPTNTHCKTEDKSITNQNINKNQNTKKSLLEKIKDFIIDWILEKLL